MVHLVPTTEVNPTRAGVSDLLNYLSHLNEDKTLSYGTIALHRFAMSTFLDPASAHALGSHLLVTRVLRVIFLARHPHSHPPARRPRPTWDVAEVPWHSGTP